jgi:hypothetical protein
MSSKINTIPELVELALGFPKNGEGQQNYTSLVAELRVGPAEFNEEKAVFTVSAKRAYVQLSLEGFDVDFGSRLGEPVRPAEIRKKISSTTEIVNERTVKGSGSITLSKVSAPDAKLSAEAGGNHHSSTTQKLEGSEEVSHYLVKAVGGDRWLISEPDEKNLNGTYLDGKTTLCQLSKQQGSNRFAIGADVVIHQRDLVFEKKKNFPPTLTNTQNKMLQIVIAKSMCRDQAYSGRLTLSRAEIEYEE